MRQKIKKLFTLLSTSISCAFIVVMLLCSLKLEAADSHSIILAPASIYDVYGMQKNNFLVMADIHLDVKTNHVMTINPIAYNTDNDLDKKTFIKLLTATKHSIDNHEIAKPKFILLLGDLVGHQRGSLKDVHDNEAQVFKLLKYYFPSIPILYVFGNNDSFAESYGNFIVNNTDYNSPYGVAERNGWGDGFLSTGNMCSAYSINQFPCIINENNKLGYYSAYVDSNLRLITLNSVLFFVNRTDNTAEQYSQIELKWFAEQLQAAKNNNESVLIAMHIPPGKNILDHVDFLRNSCNKVFLEDIKLYQKNIIGILTAHTHTEELKIIQENVQNQQNKDMALVLFTAGLSTAHGNSPSVKTFYLMPRNNQWELFDYTTFSFGEDINKNIVLRKVYNFRDQYCARNQDFKKDMLECLANDDINDITANVIKYYTVKNPNFPGIIFAPSDIFVGLN